MGRYRPLLILAALIAWEFYRSKGRPITMADKIAFARRLLPIAQQLERDPAFRIKAGIGIRQSAHESSWGTSDKALQANNIFGMTAGSWATWQPARPGYAGKWVAAPGRKIVILPTWENLKPGQNAETAYQAGMLIRQEGSRVLVNRPFRAYSSWEDSYRDWANNLATLTIYKPSLAMARAGDVLGYARAVAAAGYGTNPNYAADLAAVELPVEIA